MKLISLNTWGGKHYQPLIDFIKYHSIDTDIFCLQEIYDTKSEVKDYKREIRANLKEEIQKVLSNFQTFYFPVVYGFDNQPDPVNFDLAAGNAIFVKNSINVEDNHNYFIYKDPNSDLLKKDFSNHPTPLQYISFSQGEKRYYIFNFHGTPYPAPKLDTPQRLEQSEKVKKIMDSKNGAKILAGDFNLLPQTKSIKMFEKNMKNLIKEFNISRTRSNLSPYFGKPDFQKFADYAFVSKDIKVANFAVPEIEISDHLPLVLEFT